MTTIDHANNTLDGLDESKLGTPEPLPDEQARQTAACDMELDEARQEARQEANQYLSMGVGIGALGALTAVAFGAVCPVCVVAAPALVGVGALKRLRARRR